MIKFHIVQSTKLRMSHSSRCTCLDTPVWGLIMGRPEKFEEGVVENPRMGPVYNSWSPLHLVR